MFVLGCVLCLFCFGRLPTLSRCRSFLPDLMTVRAVMVRAALEKKKEELQQLKEEQLQRTLFVCEKWIRGHLKLSCDLGFHIF